MNIKQSYEQLNTLHSYSEIEPFTIQRYHQFFKYLPKTTKILLDVGCNTGRGGRH